jgi:hypothetical protein
VRFDFFPLRFEFTAREALNFPQGKAANILRGALGVIFRSIACAPGCENARTCEIRTSCPYARVFEPIAGGAGPSGLADSPRPFVFRARHLDGHSIEPGQSFYFDLNLFSLDRDVLAYLVRSFSALAREGLGPGRGKADLQQVRRIAVGGVPEQIVCLTDAVEPVFVDLAPLASAPERIRVEFLTPTELKYERRLADRPEFPILFARIRDRIGTLRRLYGEGPLDFDFQASGGRAAAVRMTRFEGRRVEVERRSTRTGQRHSIGGFTGVAEYEGDLREFLPWLEAATWTGVGRQPVWGKGEIRL